MKYKLTEEQLNSLITESTIKILKEASEDEGIGGAAGTGLGWLARKTVNGIQQFGQNFKNQWKNGQQNQNNTKNTEGQNTKNNDVESQNTEAPKAEQPNTNTNANTNGNQDELVTQLQAQIQQLNQKVNSLQQKVMTTTYNGMSDDDYADSGMNVGGNPNQKAQAQQGQRKSYMPNQAFTQDSYNQMKARGQERESRRPRKPRISEEKLNRIVNESIRKVLK